MLGEVVRVLERLYGEARGMRKRRREPSIAVYEAEKSLLTSLEKVVRGVERLEAQVRSDHAFLKRLIDKDALDHGWAEEAAKRLAKMRKDWPELLEPRGKD